MLDQINKTIDFLKDKKYEEFLENGHFIASLDDILFFDRIWDKLSLNGTRKIIFPRRIVFVNGAPGAGKGTNTRTIMRKVKISDRSIVVSDLLKKFQEKIDQGLLIDDEDVILLLFEKILEETHNRGIIVDGYPRTSFQAIFIQLFVRRMLKSFRCMIEVISINLVIDEKESIRRQLTRGETAIEHNKKVSQEGSGDLLEVRQTDKDPDIARARFNTFRDGTCEALKIVKKFATWYDIDSKGSFDEVRERISAALEKR